MVGSNWSLDKFNYLLFFQRLFYHRDINYDAEWIWHTRPLYVCHGKHTVLIPLENVIGQSEKRQKEHFNYPCNNTLTHFLLWNNRLNSASRLWPKQLESNCCHTQIGSRTYTHSWPISIWVFMPRGGGGVIKCEVDHLFLLEQRLRRHSTVPPLPLTSS